MADIYRPEQWQAFFMVVGGGSVTLTGLVFVALTINLKTITRDLVHRSRALSSLIGLTAIFLQSSLALLPGQNHRVLGIELLVLSVVEIMVFFGGVYKTFKNDAVTESYSHVRTILGIGLCLVEVAGALIFFFGHLSGLYLALTAVLANLFFIVSGVWLLVVGPVIEKLKSEEEISH